MWALAENGSGKMTKPWSHLGLEPLKALYWVNNQHIGQIMQLRICGESASRAIKKLTLHGFAPENSTAPGWRRGEAQLARLSLVVLPPWAG